MKNLIMFLLSLTIVGIMTSCSEITLKPDSNPLTTDNYEIFTVLAGHNFSQNDWPDKTGSPDVGFYYSFRDSSFIYKDFVGNSWSKVSGVTNGVYPDSNSGGIGCKCVGGKMIIVCFYCDVNGQHKDSIILDTIKIGRNYHCRINLIADSGWHVTHQECNSLSDSFYKEKEAFVPAKIPWAGKGNYYRRHPYVGGEFTLDKDVHICVKKD